MTTKSCFLQNNSSTDLKGILMKSSPKITRLIVNCYKFQMTYIYDTLFLSRPIDLASSLQCRQSSMSTLRAIRAMSTLRALLLTEYLNDFLRLCLRYLPHWNRLLYYFLVIWPNRCIGLLMRRISVLDALTS